MEISLKSDPPRSPLRSARTRGGRFFFNLSALEAIQIKRILFLPNNKRCLKIGFGNFCMSVLTVLTFFKVGRRPEIRTRITVLIALRGFYSEIESGFHSEI